MAIDQCMVFMPVMLKGMVECLNCATPLKLTALLDKTANINFCVLPLTGFTLAAGYC